MRFRFDLPEIRERFSPNGEKRSKMDRINQLKSNNRSSNGEKLNDKNSFSQNCEKLLPISIDRFTKSRQKKTSYLD